MISLPIYSLRLLSETDSVSSVTGVFSLDANSGQLVTATSLDAATSYYTVTVRVSDGGTTVRRADSIIVVTVNDVNDQTPVFSATSYSATIDEAVARAGTWTGLQVSFLLNKTSNHRTINKMAIANYR